VTRSLAGCYIFPVSMTISVDAVIATEELERRPRRARDASAGARAMAELQYALAGSPRTLLQKLAETALELCGAQSAGVSLLEEDEGRRFFRWHAVTGEWGALRWATLPREMSPCGTVLDRNQTLLMIDPERYFAPLASVPPRVAEALLVPFTVEGELVGTVWVVSHDPTRRFDADDRRIVTELTNFAAAAYGRLQTFRADDVRELSRLHLVSEPRPEPDAP
jgi:GAF domain-containing protein